MPNKGCYATDACATATLNMLQPPKFLLNGRGSVLMDKNKRRGFDQPLDRLDEARRVIAVDDAVIRSEEHTSELQSLMRISYDVFCLKKKNKADHYIINYLS